MKKVYSLLAIPVFAFGLVAVTPVVSAEDTPCDTSSIETTGPGSVNVITCEEESNIEIVCNNEAEIVLNSNQVSKSGDVVIEGNTIAGNGTSGDSINDYAAAINLEAVCAALTEEDKPVVTPPAVVTPQAVPPAPAPQPAPVVLPETSNTTTNMEKAILGSVAAGVAAMVSLASAKLYRRFNS